MQVSPSVLRKMCLGLSQINKSMRNYVSSIECLLWEIYEVNSPFKTHIQQITCREVKHIKS